MKNGFAKTGKRKKMMQMIGAVHVIPVISGSLSLSSRTFRLHFIVKKYISHSFFESRQNSCIQMFVQNKQYQAKKDETVYVTSSPKSSSSSVALQPQVVARNLQNTGYATPLLRLLTSNHCVIFFDHDSYLYQHATWLVTYISIELNRCL